MNRIPQLAFLLILFLTASLFAQTRNEAGAPFITNFTPKSYGAHPQNWAVVQDHRGIMYFANSIGALEYDGVTWRLIPGPNRSLVRSFAIDENNKIYVGGNADFGYFKSDTSGQLEFVSFLNMIEEEDSQFGNIWHIFITPRGVYFQGATQLFLYTPTSGDTKNSNMKLQAWKAGGRFLHSGVINNKLYLHDTGVGILSMVGDKLELVKDGDHFSNLSVEAILPFDDDKLLLASSERGLYLFDGNSFKQFSNEVSGFIIKNQLMAGSVSPNGIFAFATMRGGVILMNKNGETVQILDKNTGLLDNFVRNVYFDRHGAMWLALDGGLARAETPSPLSVYDDKSGMESYVSYIARHKGRLYVATGLGVYYLDSAKREFHLVSGITARSWWLLSMDDILLVATDDGVYSINGDRASVVRKSQEQSFYAYSLYRSKRNPNRVYVGLVDGLASLRLQGNRWVEEWRINGQNESVRNFAETDDFKLWMGTHSTGLLRIDITNADNGKAPIIERFGEETKLPLGGVSVYSIGGKIIFAMRDRLLTYDKQSNTFMQDSTFEIVAFGGAQEEYSFKEDYKNDIWINFGRETAFITKQTDGTFSVHKKPFLEISDLPNYFICPDDDGVVWMGSEEMMIRYDPTIPKDYELDYPALIRRVVAGGDSIIYGGAQTKIKNPALSYNYNSIRIEYTATSFEAVSENRYQTYLEGFDKGWSNWTEETRRDFTNLTEGDYKFNVRAKNIYQHPSSEASFAFSVTPPWFRSWWAYLLYLLAGGAFVFGLVTIRTNQLHARQRELEKTVEERTAEIQQRVEELAVINSVQDGLVRELEIQAIYDLVGEQVREIFDSQVVVIRTYDLETQLEHFQYVIEKGKRYYVDPQPLRKFHLHLIENGKPLLINKNYIEVVSKFDDAIKVEGEVPKSAIFIPLMVGDTVKGNVSLQNVDRENAFSESDVRLLSTLANSMSVALENARLFDETSRLLKETEQRNAELGVINSVQAGLVAEMDMQAIYDLVGSQVRDMFDAQSVLIGIFDHKADRELLVYNLEKGHRIYPAPRPIDQVRRHLITKREPILISENLIEVASKEFGIKKPEPVPGTKMPKSALWVPLVVGNIVNGYVSLQNIDREFAFNDSDVRLLSTLANSMSVALENARLFDETNRLLKETEQRNAELAIINSVGEAMAKQLDVETVTRIVGDKVREIFKAEATEILLLSANDNLIHVPYSYYRDYQNVEPFPVGDGLTSKILKSRKPLVHGTLAEARKLGAIILNDEEATESYMGVPIIVGKDVLGVVSVQNYNQNAYDENSVSLLSTLSSNMGVAIENARLFDETTRLLQETEQRNAELGVINSVQDGLVRELDIQAIYDLVGNRVCEMFDTQTVFIRTFDHETGLEYWQYAIEAGERLESEPRPFIWANKQLIKTCQPLVINENYAATAKKYGGKGVTVGKPPKSAVFVPLVAGDVVRGSISLQNTDREHAFSDAEVRLLTTLSNSMSVALENARLFNEAHQRATELATVNDISRALVSQLEFDALIHLVGEDMRKTFNADIVYVALLDKENSMINFPYGYGDDFSAMKFGEGLTSKIIQTGNPMLINQDIGGLHNKLGIEEQGKRAASYLGVPIPAGDENIGVISVQSTTKANRFDEDALRLLGTIAANVGVAIQNAESYRKLNEALEHLKAAQQQLVTQEKLASLGQLTAGIAHEIKNPLNFVNNFADLSIELVDELREELEKNADKVDKDDAENIRAILTDLEQNSKKINEHGKRADSIVKGMLQHSRGTKGERQPTDINAMLEEDINLAYHGLRAQDSGFNANIEKDFDANLGKIDIVPQDISRVFLNIITNGFYEAHQRSKQAGKDFSPILSAKTQALDGKIEIRIRDNGRGIPEGIREKIFQPFFTTKPTGQGTGLGLSISYDIIVQEHKGELRVDSKEGEFTEFVITLPR